MMKYRIMLWKLFGKIILLVIKEQKLRVQFMSLYTKAKSNGLPYRLVQMVLLWVQIQNKGRNNDDKKNQAFIGISNFSDVVI